MKKVMAVLLSAETCGTILLYLTVRKVIGINTMTIMIPAMYLNHRKEAIKKRSRNNNLLKVRCFLTVCLNLVYIKKIRDMRLFLNFPITLFRKV